MNTITDSPIIIQATSHSVSSIPSWFGEVVVTAQYLRRIGVLAKISERVRLARRRFGYYEGYCQLKAWPKRSQGR